MTQPVTIRTNVKLTKLILVLLCLALVSNVVFLFIKPLDLQQSSYLILFSILAIPLLLFSQRSFIVLFLLSTFCLIIVWRLAALAHYQLTVWLLTIAMLLQFIDYLLLAYENITHYRKHTTLLHQLTVFEWQLVFIRLFIGFDLIPHFCEKLFAGPLIRADDITAFTQLGVSHASAMVMIAGIIELAGSLSIACGVFTRLGAICLAVYLLVATYLGHHFSNGFIWASPGGGWEYPVLWTALILSFAVFGAGDFSIDRWLKNHFHLPTWMKHLLGGRHS